MAATGRLRARSRRRQALSFRRSDERREPPYQDRGGRLPGPKVLLPGGRRPAQLALGVEARRPRASSTSASSRSPSPSPLGPRPPPSPARSARPAIFCARASAPSATRHAVERRRALLLGVLQPVPLDVQRRPRAARPRTRAGAGAPAWRRGPPRRRRRRTGRSGARWRCARGTPPAAAGRRAPRAGPGGRRSRSPPPARTPPRARTARATRASAGRPTGSRPASAAGP